MLDPDGFGLLRWIRVDRPVPLSDEMTYRIVGIVADGNCLFHAICRAISPAYIELCRPLIPGSVVCPQLVDYISTTLADVESMDIYIPIVPGIPGFTFRENAVLPVGRRPLARLQRYLLEFREMYAAMFRRQITDILRMQKDDIRHIFQTNLSGTISLFRDMIKSEDSDNELSDDVIEMRAVSRAIDSYVEIIESSEYVPAEFIVVIKELIATDIYMIRLEDIATYKTTNTILFGGIHLHQFIEDKNYMDRSIVLVSVNSIHYELVVKCHRLDPSVDPVGLFDGSEQLIQRLRVE